MNGHGKIPLIFILVFTAPLAAWAKTHKAESQTPYTVTLDIANPCLVGYDKDGKRLDVCILAAQGYSKVTSRMDEKIYLGVNLEGKLDVPIVLMSAQGRSPVRETMRVDYSGSYLAIKQNDAHRLIRTELQKKAIDQVLKRRQELLDSLK